MTWYKVSFTEQQVETGAPGMFEKQFRQRYTAAHAPDDAALFANEIASAGIEYYLSPGASLVAGDLLTAFSSTPCSQPDADVVRLALGMRGAAKRLL